MQNLIPFNQGYFAPYWHSGCGRERFQMSTKYFGIWLLFFFLNGSGPSLEFIQGCYELKLIEISTAVMEENMFLKCGQCIFAILQLSPPGKESDPTFEHLNPHLRMF